MASASVQGGLYIMTGPGCRQPICSCSRSIAAGSYGLRPAAFSRPAAQYSAKSSSGHWTGALASRSENNASIATRIRVSKRGFVAGGSLGSDSAILQLLAAKAVLARRTTGMPATDAPVQHARGQCVFRKPNDGRKTLSVRNPFLQSYARGTLVVAVDLLRSRWQRPDGLGSPRGHQRRRCL